MSETNKYTYMEKVLEEVNKKYVSLNADEISSNNIILKRVLEVFVNEMKKNDALFRKMYVTPFYGGSYFDGVRVGHPDEFDLDFWLQIPRYAEPTIITGNIPGFVNIQLREFDRFQKQPEAAEYKKLSTLLDKKNYMINHQVLYWFRSVVDKCFNNLKRGNEYWIIIDSLRYQVKKSGSGPAVTIKLSGHGLNIDIDLVPCFILSNEQWPIGSYRKNPIPAVRNNFFIVPKQPKQTPSCEDVGRYWRLSFQEQEREIIKNKRALKPALKLLKKLRDQQNHSCISSYYIKTIFLWEVEINKDQQYWDYPLSYVFMDMLEKYQKYVANEEIQYFWNKKFNFFKGEKCSTLANIANRLMNIINDIKNHPEDPYVFTKYLLNETDACHIKQEDGLVEPTKDTSSYNCVCS